MSSHRSACALVLAVLSIAVINNASARKDRGEYWVTVTKEEALIPESKVLQVGAAVIANELNEGNEELVVLGGSESKRKKKGSCDHETEKLGKEGRGKGFSDDFEPRPNVSAYGDDDAGLKEKKEERKHFADDFEPRPNVSAYGDDDAGLKEKKEERKHFADDFEPRPNVSAYGDDDAGLKGKQEERKHFADDFEPRPNVSAYGDDDAGSKQANSKQGHQKHFADDFEPRPNVSAYGEDDVGMKIKKN